MSDKEKTLESFNDEQIKNKQFKVDYLIYKKYLDFYCSIVELSDIFFDDDEMLGIDVRNLLKQFEENENDYNERED